MLRFNWVLVWWLVWVAIVSAQDIPQQRKADVAKGAAVGGKSVKPLPAGGYARLGSPRMRIQTNSISGYRMSSDGKLVVAAGSDVLYWWNLETGEELYRHNFDISGSRNGKLFKDGTLLIYRSTSDPARYFLQKFDPKTGKLGAEVKLENLPFQGVASFDDTGSRVAICRNENEDRAMVYDTATGKRLWDRESAEKILDQPLLFHDGKRVALVYSSRVEIYDYLQNKLLTTWKPKGLEEGSQRLQSADLYLSRDDQYLVVSGERGGHCILVHHLATGKEFSIPKQDGVFGFLADNKRLVTRGEGSLSIWDENGKRVSEQAFPHARDASLSDDGRRLVTECDDSIVVYDIADSGQVTMAKANPNPPGLPSELHFNKDGSIVAKLKNWNGVATWKNGEKEATLFRSPVIGTLAAAPPRSSHLFIRDETHLMVTDRQTGKVTQRFEWSGVRSSGCIGLAAPHDGRFVVGQYEDGLHVFDVKSGAKRTIKSAFKSRGADEVAVSADGRFAAGVGSDEASDVVHVELYSIQPDQAIRHFRLNGRSEQILLSDSGRILAVACVRESKNGENIRSIQVFDSERGFVFETATTTGSSKLQFALSPDGRMLAMTRDKHIEVYETITGQLRSKIATDTVAEGFGFGRDGRTLAIAGGGWPIALVDLTGQADFNTITKPGEWNSLWTRLEKSPSTAAYGAAREMALTPNETLKQLATLMKATPPADPIALKKWVTDLDAPAFATRNEASKQLRSLGERATPELKRVLETTDSVEVRQRVETLLAITTKPTPENIRQSRAIEVIEWIGSVEAKAILERLTKGAEGSWQTREALAALTRLNAKD